WLDPFANTFSRDDTITAVANIFSTIGNGALLGTLCIAIFAAGLILKDKRLKDAGWRSLFALFLVSIFLHILKAVFERPRMGYSDSALIALLENPSIFDFTGRYNSFPSGHTTVSFILAYTISYFYPRMRFILYPIAALVGFSRVYLGSHYPSDIVSGAFIGTGFGYLLAHRILKERWKEFLLFTLVIAIAFFKLGGLILFDVDEAVFSEAAREMLEIGDYITPIYNYIPRYDKPIFFYWLISIAFWIFGTTEFAARFWSAGFGAALVVITFLFVRSIKGQRAAIWASLCLLLNLEFFLYTHSAVTDMTLAFFITSSMYSLYMGIYHGRNMYSKQADGGNTWFFIFWLSSALAVLTKGAIGLLFPVVMASLYLVVTRNMVRLKELLRPRYILIFFLVATPWFAAQLYINGWDFYDAFIVKHHIKRYTGVISGHSGPIYFYLGILLIGFFPWVSFLPGAIYRGLKDRGLYLFCTVWFLFIFIFFSISKTKLPNYILPLFPAMAVMIGVSLDENAKGRGSIAFYFLAGLSLVTSVLLFVMPYMDIKMDIHYPDHFFYLTGFIFLFIGVFGIMGKTNKTIALGGIASATTILLVFLRTYGLPPVNIYLQKTLYDYSIYSKSVLDGNDILATYEINQPSILFYSGRRVEKIESWNREKLKNLAEDRRILIITKKDRIEELMEITELITLDNSGRFAILTNRKDMPGIKLKTPRTSR
ncbi:MAG: phosphatase PAP2 family protein, partial [Thermodesulfobacteriota bacterium]